MLSGIIITFGILFFIPGIFFFAPGLIAISGVVISDKSDELMRKKYRPMAKGLLLLGAILILIGVAVGVW